MQQDTLTHVNHTVAPETPHEVADTGAVKATSVKWQVAQPDTVAREVAPGEWLPVPGGQPLTCVPDIFQKDCWADGPIRIQKSEFAERLDSTSGMTFGETVLQPGGVAGDPVPYRFKTDNFVTIVLLLSFFLVVWVISRSRHFLQMQVKDFFHSRGERGNLFSETVDTKFRGQVFLIFQTCFVLGLLFFDYTQERQVEVFNQVSPYRILGLSVALTGVYYALKTGLYAFVNSIFFSPAQRVGWTQTYLLSVLGTGLALLPVALFVIYFDMNFDAMAHTVVCILVIDKILLFYKCSRTFFDYTFGWVHLFLYFCALEIVPLLILLRTMVYANSYLLTIN